MFTLHIRTVTLTVGITKTRLDITFMRYEVKHNRKGDNGRRTCEVHSTCAHWRLELLLFLHVHSILFTILVCDSLNCGYYVQVGYVPASLGPNTPIQRYSRNDGEAFSENSIYLKYILENTKKITKPRLNRYHAQRYREHNSVLCVYYSLSRASIFYTN